MTMKHTFSTIKPFDHEVNRKEREKPRKREASLPAGKLQLANVAVGDKITYSITGTVIQTRMVDKGREDEFDHNELRMELDSSELTTDKPSSGKAAMKDTSIDLVG